MQFLDYNPYDHIFCNRYNFRNLCIPIFTTTAAINGALNEALTASKLDKEDTFIAGHSLGGVAARYFVDGQLDANHPFAGTLLFGTNYPAQLDNPKTAQLTVAGELDMVCVGNMAPTYEAFKDKADSDLSAALLTNPVMIIPGMDHSDFCPGFFVKGFLFCFCYPRLSNLPAL